MAFANTNYSDILATTIENRSAKVADNVTKNNGILVRLNQKGNIVGFSGGHKIIQEIAFQENGNGGWYSGYDQLPTNAADVISAAEFDIKQYAVPVVMSGLEMLQNAGKQQIIDLMQGRLRVAEATMKNQISQSLYGDGTGSGGKQITGMDAAVPVTNTNTYGGIARSTWTFWKNVSTNTSGIVAATIQASWNTTWASTVRGSDRPDLILVDSTTWAMYMASLQPLQRFTDPDMASLGFPTIKYMDADVLLDGGIGGFATANTAYFLNTDYIFFRPHSARNMVPLSPNRRYATNQDAEVQILAWAGNLASNGPQFCARWDNN